MALVGSTLMIKINQEDLNRILDEHEKWARTRHRFFLFRRGKRADLRGLDLTGLSLSQKDLRKVIFAGGNKQAAKLDEARLTQANLSGVNLTRVSMRGAHMPLANLSEATLERATLTNVFAHRTIFTGANLTGTIMPFARLDRARLEGVNAAGVQLLRSRLRNAVLTKATLSDANFFSADLTAANVSDATFTNADLDYSVFNRANMQNANLTGAHAFGWKIHGANMIGCSAPGAARVPGSARAAVAAEAPLRLPGDDELRATLERYFDELRSSETREKKEAVWKKYEPILGEHGKVDVAPPHAAVKQAVEPVPKELAERVSAWADVDQAVKDASSVRNRHLLADEYERAFKQRYELEI